MIRSDKFRQCVPFDDRRYTGDWVVKNPRGDVLSAHESKADAAHEASRLNREYQESAYTYEEWRA